MAKHKWVIVLLILGFLVLFASSILGDHCEDSYQIVEDFNVCRRSSPCDDDDDYYGEAATACREDCLQKLNSRNEVRDACVAQHNAEEQEQAQPEQEQVTDEDDYEQEQQQQYEEEQECPSGYPVVCGDGCCPVGTTCGGDGNCYEEQQQDEEETGTIEVPDDLRDAVASIPEADGDALAEKNRFERELYRNLRGDHKYANSKEEYHKRYGTTMDVLKIIGGKIADLDSYIKVLEKEKGINEDIIEDTRSIRAQYVSMGLEVKKPTQPKMTDEERIKMREGIRKDVDFGQHWENYVKEDIDPSKQAKIKELLAEGNKYALDNALIQIQIKNLLERGAYNDNTKHQIIKLREKSNQDIGKARWFYESVLHDPQYNSVYNTQANFALAQIEMDQGNSEYAFNLNMNAMLSVKDNPAAKETIKNAIHDPEMRKKILDKLNLNPKEPPSPKTSPAVDAMNKEIVAKTDYPNIDEPSVINQLKDWFKNSYVYSKAKTASDEVNKLWKGDDEAARGLVTEIVEE